MQQAYFRALYELSGFTHEELAQQLNVSVRSIERWCSQMEPPEGVIFQMEIIEQAVGDLTQDILNDIDSLLENNDEPFLIMIHAYRNKDKFSKSKYWKKRAQWVDFPTQWEIVKRLYCVLTAMAYDVKILDMEDDEDSLITVLVDEDMFGEMTPYAC